jgi:hypothetical protein
MPRLRVTLFAFALVVALVGLNPLPAFASDTRRIDVKPPVGSAGGRANMTQGWHTPENGVDWGVKSPTCCNMGNKYMFLAYAYRSYSTAIDIAYVDFYQSNVSNCVRGTARFSKITSDSTILGYLFYRHAYTTKLTNMTITASSAGFVNELNPGSVEASQESWETCGWSAAHLHHGSSSFTLRQGSAPGAIPSSPASYTYGDPTLKTSVTERYLKWTV